MSGERYVLTRAANGAGTTDDNDAPHLGHYCGLGLTVTGRQQAAPYVPKIGGCIHERKGRRGGSISVDQQPRIAGSREAYYFPRPRGFATAFFASAFAAFTLLRASFASFL